MSVYGVFQNFWSLISQVYFILCIVRFFTIISEFFLHVFDKADEILIYNANFDISFMKSHGFSFKESCKITDVMKEYSVYKLKNKRFKLSAAASEFGYTFTAHDALEDVKATLVVHNEVNKFFNKNIFIKYFYYIIKICFKYLKRVK